MTNSPTLFEGSRMTMDEAIDLTVETMNVYLERYDHLAFAFSGGKDSSATLTLIAHLISIGRVKQPKSVIAFYADTRMELTPLHQSALAIMSSLEERGIKTNIVLPAMDDRFFVYILGRGVPPPSNTFRWCTSQLKIEPMEKALVQRAVDLGMGEILPNGRNGKLSYNGFGQSKILMITGVRLGESAARDERIALSCSKDGAECGQGWLQQSAKEGLNDTLAPLLHWRVCHVWDWLNFFAPEAGFPTRLIAESYGGDEATEINARTGCVGCNLASKDLALETILAKYPDRWGYLSPLLRLRPIYAEMKKPENRLRKWGETLQDGSLAANQGRLGPLTLEARRRFLTEIEAIQNEININPSRDIHTQPFVSLISFDEKKRILDLIEAKTWPNNWTGEEMRGDEMTDKIFRDGTIQPWMFEGEGSLLG
jgi:DNA sulfur modification protein DndC